DFHAVADAVFVLISHWGARMTMLRMFWRSLSEYRRCPPGVLRGDGRMPVRSQRRMLSAETPSCFATFPMLCRGMFCVSMFPSVTILSSVIKVCVLFGERGASW